MLEVRDLHGYYGKHILQGVDSCCRSEVVTSRPHASARS